MFADCVLQLRSLGLWQQTLCPERLQVLQG
jgi:hypothetical protein